MSTTAIDDSALADVVAELATARRAMATATAAGGPSAREAAVTSHVKNALDRWWAERRAAWAEEARAMEGEERAASAALHSIVADCHATIGRLRERLAAVEAERDVAAAAAAAADGQKARGEDGDQGGAGDTGCIGLSLSETDTPLGRVVRDALGELSTLGNTIHKVQEQVDALSRSEDLNNIQSALRIALEEARSAKEAHTADTVQWAAERMSLTAAADTANAEKDAAVASAEALREEFQSTLLQRAADEERLRDRVAALENQIEEARRSVRSKRSRSPEVIELSERCISGQPSELRRDVIRFFFDGQDAIEKLKSEIASFTNVQRERDDARAQLQQFTESRAALVSSLQALTTEVEKLREENRKGQHLLLGMESENRSLVASLTESLRGEISHDELERIAHALRRSAAEASAQSLSVHDALSGQRRDVAQQSLLRLEAEVNRLQTQKERLERGIATRTGHLKSIDATIAHTATIAHVRPRATPQGEEFQAMAALGDASHAGTWDAEVARMIERLAEAERKRDEAESSAKALREQIAVFQNTLDEVLEAHDRDRRSANEAARVHAEDLLRARQAATCAEAKAEVWRLRLDEVATSAVTLTQTAMDLHERTQTLTLALKRVDGEHAKLRSEIQRLKRATDVDRRVLEDESFLRRLVDSITSTSNNVKEAYERAMWRAEGEGAQSVAEVAAALLSTREALERSRAEAAEARAAQATALVSIVDEAQRAWGTEQQAAINQLNEKLRVTQREAAGSQRGFQRALQRVTSSLQEPPRQKVRIEVDAQESKGISSPSFASRMSVDVEGSGAK